MGKTIKLQDKSFRLYISAAQIQKAIKSIAGQINQDYKGKKPLIIPILNGSFMFASDLIKELTCACEISFIKASSYSGTSSAGDVAALIGLSEDITGRDIIIIEDIVDTGHTLSKILSLFEAQLPASIHIAALLFKPQCLKNDIKIDYAGIEISNEFVVGYGLDYNGLGRNLREIYQLI
jgi:hypoxanthine phosphoribosyltransferase